MQIDSRQIDEMRRNALTPGNTYIQVVISIHIYPGDTSQVALFIKEGEIGNFLKRDLAREEKRNEQPRKEE
jgi:hypothetical protein